MNIAINATTLKMGGALQVASSIIEELTKIPSDDRFLILSSYNLYNQISSINFPENIILKLIETSPAKISTRKTINRKLESIINEFSANVVLTIFGPSYWKPSIKHICGFADGWCYYPDTIAFKQLNLIESVKRKLLSWYKLKHLKSEAQYYFLETEDARCNFARNTGISLEKILTISNTFSSAYNNSIPSKKLLLPKNKNNKTRFLILSANYPHKNIKILNELIPLLRKEISSFEFITTIPENDYSKLFNKDIRDYIINIGPIKVNDCVQLYREVNFLFLPTLLETFTATYPEAMIMKIPILTSDLSFARDICGKAALYFNPLDAVDIVKKISEIIYDNKKINKLVFEGTMQIKKFPSAAERASQLIELCHKL